MRRGQQGARGRLSDTIEVVASLTARCLWPLDEGQGHQDLPLPWRIHNLEAMQASSMASAIPGASRRDHSTAAPEARGVRGRRCPSAWPYVADAVIAACTSVT